MTNDSKYGRLYPERAVAPARVVLEALKDSINAVAATQAAKALEQLDRLGFPPDEPLFLLRGQDTLAACAVRHYAEDVRLSKIKEPMRATLRAHILEFADRMEAWEPRKLPD